MSLLLSGAKTVTFAGTEMQCLEVYTGEAYTININFTNSVGGPVDITGWSFYTTVAYYDVDTISYPAATPDEITLGNITVYAGAPTPPTALITTPVTPLTNGTAWLYIPTDLADGTGGRPNPALVQGKADPSTLAIVTIEITRQDAVSLLDNVSREPLGFIVRYQ